MSTEVEVVSALPARRELILSPVMDLELAKSRMEQFQQFVAFYLEPSTNGGQDGGDYGPIPGAGQKKVLLKSGADKLCELYGLYDEYEIDAQEDFGTKLFYYKIKCVLKSRRDDSVVGTGVGSCSTYESKYRWRDSQRTCPNCKAAVIIKGRDEYGGGWLCFAKKGGCGQKFKDGDKSIESQAIGRVENPDIMDTVNTVLKMAKKRAKIDAVIGVTRSSGIFTQDLEEVPMPPAKPPAERTTEETFVEKPKTTANGNGNHPPVVAEIHAEAEKSLTPTPASLPADCVESGQAKNFEIEFKNALNPKFRKQATDISHAWLKKAGIVDGDGNGTAKAIRKESFYDVREQAVEYASKLEVWP